MNENYKVGNFICQRRKEKGLTQAQLGEQLNVTNKAVSRWENGWGLPDSGLILPLSEILGVTADELLRGEFVTTVLPTPPEASLTPPRAPSAPPLASPASEAPAEPPAPSPEESIRRANAVYAYTCAKRQFRRDSAIVLPQFAFTLVWFLWVFVLQIELFPQAGYFFEAMTALVIPLFLIGIGQTIYAIVLIRDTLRLRDMPLVVRILLCVAAWFAVMYVMVFIYLYRIVTYIRCKRQLSRI